MSAMLEILFRIYLAGAGITALAYVAMWCEARGYPVLRRLLIETVIPYVLLWPWRVVGFPALCYIRHRRGTLQPPW